MLFFLGGLWQRFTTEFIARKFFCHKNSSSVWGLGYHRKKRKEKNQENAPQNSLKNTKTREEERFAYVLFVHTRSLLRLSKHILDHLFTDPSWRDHQTPCLLFVSMCLLISQYLPKIFKCTPTCVRKFKGTREQKTSIYRTVQTSGITQHNFRLTRAGPDVNANFKRQNGFLFTTTGRKIGCCR